MCFLARTLTSLNLENRFLEWTQYDTTLGQEKAVLFLRTPEDKMTGWRLPDYVDSVRQRKLVYLPCVTNVLPIDW